MYTFLIKIVIWVHNFLYRLLSVLVLKANNGIHPKHKILNYKKFFVDHITSDDVVLDIGCGNGALAYALAGKSQKVFAIDIVEKNIRFAQQKFSHDHISYVHGDATTYDFHEKFDVVTLSNVLEHIEERPEFLSKIRQLAPTFLIRVPLITRDWLAVYKRDLGVDYRLDKTHFVEYTEELLEKELVFADLVITEKSVRFGELYVIAKHRS